MKDITKHELYGSYCKFMKDAGILTWDLRGEPVISNPARAAALAALADIEEDSKYMQRKLRLAGALKDSSLIKFNDQWLCEEQEHATVLRALARLNGWGGEPAKHGLKSRDRRSIVAYFSLRVGHLSPDGIAATYLALGSIQEFVALSAYVVLADTSARASETEILRGIARQEGRHMKFYRSGAQSLLSNGSPITRQFARTAIGRFWRPPGIDLLGIDRWLHSLGWIIEVPGARSRFAGMDRILHGYPGMEDLHPMSKFLNRVPVAAPSESRVSLGGGF